MILFSLHFELLALEAMYTKTAFQSHPGASPWSSGSVLDHRSLPPVLKSRRGIAEGCFIFDLASLPLEVARPI